MDTNICLQLEALLFMKGEPVSLEELSRLLSIDTDTVSIALTELDSVLQTRGIRLQRIDDRVSLATAPEAAPLLESIAREELSRDLSKAALETLAIVLYRGPLTKSRIDHIRGVNCVYILRNLQVRGLIEKRASDESGAQYYPTFELLQHLGITRQEELPGYEMMEQEILESEVEVEENLEEDGESI